MRCAAPLAVTTLFLAACLSRGDPCGSDLDCAGGSRCVDDHCSGPQKPRVTPAPVCSDALEPNDRAGDARTVVAGTFAALNVCAGDDDWFSIVLGESDRLTVTVTARQQSLGRLLRLGVHGPSGAILATASGAGMSGEARIGELRAAETGRHFVRVYGSADLADTLTYDLALSTTTRRCSAGDSLEASRAQGAPLLADGSLDAVLSSAGEAWFRVDLRAGDALRAGLSYDNLVRGVELMLYRNDGAILRPWRPALARAAGHIELAYGPVSRAETEYLRISGPAGLAYRVDAARSLSTTLREGRVQGVARYEDRAPSRSGLGEPTPRGIPGASIEIFRKSDGYVVGAGIADSAGRFALGYVNRGDLSLGVRALASRDDGLAATRVYRAQNCRESYAIAADIAPGSDAPVELLARATDAGGAFNLHAIVQEALVSLAPLQLPAASFPLDIFWERGAKHDCGSCESLGALYIGGGAADADEYDDPVVLHELGHYFEETWGRTSTPGGRHDGSRTDPPLGWSEGFATWFSSALRGDPLYIDTRETDVFVEDLESPTRPQSIGVDGDVMTGAISETLVSALLWDLHDPARGGEPFDSLALSFAQLLSPTIDYFRRPSFVGRGADGIDLVDYLDGLLCLGLAARADVEPIVLSRRFPYDFAGPAACARHKPQPRTLSALRVRPWKKGERRRAPLARAALSGSGLPLVVLDGRVEKGADNRGSQ